VSVYLSYWKSYSHPSAQPGPMSGGALTPCGSMSGWDVQYRGGHPNLQGTLFFIFYYDIFILQQGIHNGNFD
jgi:hypothetical protein